MFFLDAKSHDTLFALHELYEEALSRFALSCEDVVRQYGGRDFCSILPIAIPNLMNLSGGKNHYVSWGGSFSVPFLSGHFARMNPFYWLSDICRRSIADENYPSCPAWHHCRGVIYRSQEITCGTKLTAPLNDTGQFALNASIQRTSFFLSGCYCRNVHGTPFWRLGNQASVKT
uniref:hypothetical protein n=1 Tax=Serratia proteamaculans TaxID=28151 RepID=UPI001F4C1C47|nr:hypothetical protein [Serratia proteamaculans]